VEVGDALGQGGRGGGARRARRWCSPGRERRDLRAREPGIGKTSLLEDAGARADGARVLRARGVEAESQLAFAGLFGLVRPLLTRTDELPQSSASALLGALGLGPPSGAERFAVGAATLGLLSLAAEERPIVCLIDDLHWIDVGSRDALLFAARRLGPEGIAVIMSVREPEGRQIDTAGIPELWLRGLDVAAAEELLRSRGLTLAAGALSELTERCGGNPLALLEVTGRLSERQRAGHEPLGEILPVGPEVQRSFRARLDGLADREREALLVLALQEDDDPAALGAALGRLVLETSDLDAAERAGLVERTAGRAVIAHPLARAAVVQAASSLETRRAHRALGDAYEDPERAAWHVALGAEGSDEPAAAGLEAVGGTAMARGDPLTGSRALALAAGLTPEPGARSRRHLAAGRMAAVAGVPPFEMLETARSEATDPEVADEALIMQAAVMAWTGQHEGLRALLRDEVGEVEQRSPERAAILHGVAVTAAFALGDIPAAIEHGRTADGLWDGRPLSGDPGSLEMMAQIGPAIAVAIQGDRSAALRRLEPCVVLLEERRGSIDLGNPLAVALTMIGAFDHARRVVTACRDQARAGGRLAALSWSLAAHAQLAWREGDLDGARGSGIEAAELARLCGNPHAAASGMGCCALADAARGRGDEVRRWVEEGLALAQAIGSLPVEGVFHQATGIAALTRGELDEARVALGRAVPPYDEGFVLIPVRHDLVEALMRLGRVDEARAQLGRLTGGEADDVARAERCRALVTDDDDAALEHFEAALSFHARQPAALEHARTHLLYGERLRRMGRRGRGRAQLEQALAGFERIGAEGFTERAQAELRATGARPARRDPTAPATLTGQERQVAAEVAIGRSNREVAAALFISPKTVEMHLTRVYRKLGLRSRAQLVRLAAEGGLGEGVGTEAPRT
jgi:DNA-binding CsgD family transcriptional regulator